MSYNVNPLSIDLTKNYLSTISGGGGGGGNVVIDTTYPPTSTSNITVPSTNVARQIFNAVTPTTATDLATSAAGAVRVGATNQTLTVQGNALTLGSGTTAIGFGTGTTINWANTSFSNFPTISLSGYSQFGISAGTAVIIGNAVRTLNLYGSTINLGNNIPGPSTINFLNQTTINFANTTLANFPTASTSAAGIVQLVDLAASTVPNSTSTTQAATANALTNAYNTLNGNIPSLTAGLNFGSSAAGAVTIGATNQTLTLRGTTLTIGSGSTAIGFGASTTINFSNTTISNFPTASTSAAGIVQLVDLAASTDPTSSSTTQAVTANALTNAYNRLNSLISTGSAGDVSANTNFGTSATSAVTVGATTQGLTLRGNTLTIGSGSTGISFGSSTTINFSNTTISNFPSIDVTANTNFGTSVPVGQIVRFGVDGTAANAPSTYVQGGVIFIGQNTTQGITIANNIANIAFPTTVTGSSLYLRNGVLTPSNIFVLADSNNAMQPTNLTGVNNSLYLSGSGGVMINGDNAKGDVRISGGTGSNTFIGNSSRNITIATNFTASPTALGSLGYTGLPLMMTVALTGETGTVPQSTNNTTTAIVQFRTPCRMRLLSARANVNVVDSTNSISILASPLTAVGSAYVSGNALFTTALLIPAAQSTTVSAGGAGVVSSLTLGDDTIIGVYINNYAGTTAQGLKLTLIYTPLLP